MTDMANSKLKPTTTERPIPPRGNRAMSLPTLHTDNSKVSNTKTAQSSPSSPSSPNYPYHSPHATYLSPTTYPELPADPKNWSSSDVATYLAYCLRLYPPAIIRDLTKFVREDTSLNGRRFLRLKEEQLRYMGFNERWIKLIMLGVKALRRESLTQKILPNGGIKEEPEEFAEEDGNDDTFSDATTTLTTNATSISPSLNSDDKEFLVADDDNNNNINNGNVGSISMLTANDKEFIQHQLAKLEESLKKSSSSSPSSFLQWPSKFSFSVSPFSRSPKEINESKNHHNNYSYRSGLIQGSVIGCSLMWICMKLADKYPS